jgi:hypothetical protein
MLSALSVNCPESVSLYESNDLLLFRASDAQPDAPPAVLVRDKIVIQVVYLSTALCAFHDPTSFSQ